MTQADRSATSVETTGREPVLLPRRELLATLGLGAAALTGAGLGVTAFAHAQDTSPLRLDQPQMSPESLGWDPRANRYVLPKLTYDYDALEPHIDARTMELHHSKHHQGYVDGLNKALDALEAIRQGDRDASETQRWARSLAFNGSGHFLHSIFWQVMASPDNGAGGQPPRDSAIAERINRDFGSFRQFADQFKAAASQVEGSGWGILVLEPVSGRLMIMQAEKHQNLTAWGVQPLLPVDVWEHAYYLKYQNRRGDYVNAFMNVINWDAVNQRYESLMPTAQAAR